MQMHRVDSRVKKDEKRHIQTHAGQRGDYAKGLWEKSQRLGRGPTRGDDKHGGLCGCSCLQLKAHLSQALTALKGAAEVDDGAGRAQQRSQTGNVCRGNICGMESKKKTSEMEASIYRESERGWGMRRAGLGLDCSWQQHGRGGVDNCTHGARQRNGMKLGKRV